MLWGRCFPSLLWRLAVAAPVAAAERRIVTDPTGTLHLRRFDGKVIGALHKSEMVKIVRTSADRNGKSWAYVAYETNGEGRVIGTS